ncbi:MAG: hypothetical protein RR359_00760 [Bacilli bacterium]
MNDINTILLEDNNNYIIIDEIPYNDFKYVYLTNALDSNDFCIRKLINNQDLIGLDNEQEFDNALKLFRNKRVND